MSSVRQSVAVRPASEEGVDSSCEFFDQWHTCT